MGLLRRRDWIHRDPIDGVEEKLSFLAAFFERRFTANQMTLLGFIFSVPSGIFFLLGFLVPGTIFMIASLCTDKIDGTIGRYQEKKYRFVHGLMPMTLEEESKLSIIERIEFRGVTHLGCSLDPLVDKIRIVIFLFSIGNEVINSLIVWGIVLVGVLLTLIRPVKQSLKLDKVSANRLGKYKILVEIAGMALLVFLSPWSSFIWYKPLVDVCFLVALLFGLASLVGHVKTGIDAYRKRKKIPRVRSIHRRKKRHS